MLVEISFNNATLLIKKPLGITLLIDPSDTNNK